MAWAEKQGEVDVILRFEMDEAAQKRVQQGISTIGEELDKLRVIVADETASKLAHANEMKRLKDLATEALRVQSGWRRMQFAARSMGEVFMITTAASTAMFVGAVALASKYVTDAKAATAVVQGWRVSVDELKTSQSRVGAVLAAQILPLLEKAAALADKAAAFAEAHPGALKAAVSVAGVVMGLSAIGMAVSKGIKIYADIGYMAATYRQAAAAAVYETASVVDLEAANIHMAAATMQVTGAVAAPVAGAVTGPAAAAAAAWAAAKSAGAAAQKASETAAKAVAGTLGAKLAAENAVIAWAKAHEAENAYWKAATAARAAEAAPLGAAPAAAKGAGLLATLPAIITVVLGIMLGMGIYDKIAEATGRSSAKTILGQWTSVGAGAGLGALGAGVAGVKALLSGKDIIEAIRTGATIGFREGFLGMSKMTGVAPTPAVGSTEYMSMFVKQNLQLWIDYNKQMTTVTETYNKQRLALDVTYEKQRTDTVASYNQQRAAAEESYNLGVSRSWRDFEEGESASIQQYYEDRVKAAQDYAKRIREMEQDHQIEMARDLEDHEDRQRELLESRDGLAMIREDEAYEKERRRKEEDYALEMGRISEEYAARLRETEAQFARERAQRQDDFAQRMADNAADHALEVAQAAAAQKAALEKLKVERDEQKKTLEESYEEQLSTLETAFRDRLRLIDQAILGDYAAVQATAAQMTADFRAWLAAVAASNATPIPGPEHAVGGYLHFPGEEYEFLLSNRSTQIAERALGGKLSQERILAAMLGGGGGGRYVDQRTIQFTGMTEADRAAIRRDIYYVTQEVLTEAMRL